MIQEPTMMMVEIYDEENYNEMLDEIYSPIKIEDVTFNASYVLKECDPTAYRCGFNDFQVEVEYWVCPICDEEHKDYDDAKWCCQAMPTCSICGEEYETEWEAETCCEEEEDDE